MSEHAPEFFMSLIVESFAGLLGESGGAAYHNSFVFHGISRYFFRVAVSWKLKCSGWCRDWVYSNMTPSELNVLLVTTARQL